MFSDRLSELRRKSGRTQEEIAKLLGVAKTTYASYEQGKRMPDAEIQNKIADLFNVTLDYLHGRNDTPQWATKKDVMDLKEFLDGNAKFAYGGGSLTDEENEKLEIALTQIFWKRHKHGSDKNE